MEQWKPIRGFEGIYEVSDQGNVRSLDRWVEVKSKLGKKWELFIKGIIKTVSKDKDKDGYVCVHLQGQRRMLHRIMFESFVRTLESNEDVDHIDGNPSNFTIHNLRACKRINNLTFKNVKWDRKAPYVGVRSKQTKKYGIRWAGQIWCPIKKTNLHLGYFSTPEQAHEAYRKARLEIYGDDIKSQE